jgi:hypothetical protein
MVKLTEIAKGNIDSISSQSLEEILDNQLNLFTRNMPSQSFMFSQDSEVDKENVPMRSNAPTGSNGGQRLRSANERAVNGMRNSNKRAAICTLCHVPGHRIGRMCTIVIDQEAHVIGHREIPQFVERLGNPALVLVERPDRSVKDAIKEWMSDGGHSIPSRTKHLVVKRCYYSAKPNESYQMNVVEVNLLEDGGMPMAAHCPAYFPAYKVTAWITQNCSSNGRKKHLLSSLCDANQSMSQDLYEYSP